MSVSDERVVVFIRHGHSEWNLSNRFTGWTDVILTEVGLAEAAEAGQRLARSGYQFDEVHLSMLQRTHQTWRAMASAARWGVLPIYTSWRLNERHYGALQGMNKQAIFAAWGEQRSRLWWRGYYDAPPPLERSDPRHPRFDPLYKELEPALLPATESLRDCQLRVMPYWYDMLLPRLAAGQRMVVVSHGNTLRSIVMALEGLEPEAVEQLEIPSGVPLIYRFGADATLLSKAWLE